MEASEKQDEMVPPRHEAEECHVQERHTADTTMITVPFSPPFLAGTPIIFLGDKLDGDSICLESVISTMSDVIKF